MLIMVMAVTGACSSSQKTLSNGNEKANRSFDHAKMNQRVQATPSIRERLARVKDKEKIHTEDSVEKMLKSSSQSVPSTAKIPKTAGFKPDQNNDQTKQSNIQGTQKVFQKKQTRKQQPAPVRITINESVSVGAK